MTTRTFWSRPRGPLLLGAAACAACCAPPLAAIAIGAGAASTLAMILEPIAGVLLAAASVLAIAIVVRRRRAALAASCAVDGACGCGPVRTGSTIMSLTAPDDEPVACTMDLRDRAGVQRHLDDYRAAFAHLVKTEPDDDGFRWHFRASPGLADQLRALAEREHACCRFLGFTLRNADDAIVLEVRAGRDARTFVDEFMRLPERLREERRPGHDVAHVKRRVAAAGLRFTADRAE
jgi:hypothetical protein